MCNCIKDDNQRDECLGMLSGVANACCGHNNPSEAYVQFLDGSCVRGENAVIIQNIIKTSSERDLCNYFKDFKIRDFEISKCHERKGINNE